MITNGNLIVLAPKVPSALLPDREKLSLLILHSSLLQYFCTRSRASSIDEVLSLMECVCSDKTIVVIEREFFAEENMRNSFKEELIKLGVPSNRILFGEYWTHNSGYHRLLFAIKDLCES